MTSTPTIYCMAAAPEEEPVPLFVGREDGTLEKYISIRDADLGQPSLILRGHKRCITGIVAVSADEVHTCSLDGSIKQWSAEVDAAEGTTRVLRSTTLPSALHCIALHEGRVYAGGADGALHVLDNQRKSSWEGHQDILSCITFSPSGLVITGGYDNQIRVWDASLGKTVRLLLGHNNHVKCLCVVGGGDEDVEDDEEAEGSILSFSRDGTMKVWAVPQIGGDEQAEDYLNIYTDADENKRGAVVSFREDNNVSVEVAVTDDTGTSLEHSMASLLKSSGTDGQEAAAPAGTSDDNNVRDPLNDIMNNPDAAAKSAIKVKGKPLIKRETALGTIELPEYPHFLYRPEEGSILYVGTTNGYVLGIKAGNVARTVTDFVSANRAKVRQEVRTTRLTLRRSHALARKECRKRVKAEEARLLRVARRELREKRAKEREARKKERAERAAERAALRAERAEDYGDDEEGEEEEDDYEEEDDAEEEEGVPEGDGDEEDEEADPLRILSEAQRNELTEFTRARETERDEKMSALEKAVEQHLASVEPLAQSTYDRSRDQFFHMKSTTYAKAGGGDAVLSLVESNGHVYAAQGARVVPVDIAMGSTRL